jgi:hypothetical protein
MQRISYDRHRFPPEVIRHAIWLYLRFTLSYRDVEELLIERGIEVSYETVRRWVLKFGPSFARNLRRLRPRPADTWHLDELSGKSCKEKDGRSRPEVSGCYPTGGTAGVCDFPTSSEYEPTATTHRKTARQ